MSGALDAIRNERERQNAKWGEQNHPDGTGRYSLPLRSIVKNAPVRGRYGCMNFAADLALLAKVSTDRKARGGIVTWADILLEEVFEALAENTPERLRVELIQVAAVASQWAEAIDRREATR